MPDEIETNTGNDISTKELAAIKALRATTSSDELKRFLGMYLNGQLDLEKIDAANQLVAAPEIELGALSVFRTHTTDPTRRNLATQWWQRTEDTEENRRKDARLKYAMRLYREAPYMEDLVASFANADWLEEDRFVHAYKAAKNISAWGHDIRWRCYTLMSCAKKASRLPGQFVECGTDRGGTAIGVINYIGRDQFADRKFYLFDTFEGVVKKQMNTEETQLSRLPDERYPSVIDEVTKTFSEYDFVKIVKGTVPDTLKEIEPTPVAYLHIDMNVTEPECAALEYYWPHLVEGAPVIFDDYGFPFHKVQKRELDQLAAKLGTSIMSLPTGQGLLWK